MLKAVMVLIHVVLLIAVVLYSLYTTFEATGTFRKEELSKEDVKRITANLKNQIVLFITGFLTAGIALW